MTFYYIGIVAIALEEKKAITFYLGHQMMFL